MTNAILMTLTMLPCQAPTPQLAAPLTKIWDKAPHNAFTDLLRHRDRWYCVFREGAGHAKGAGVIRILTSKDGSRWESAAVIESDADLRDPHICVTPDGRLMLVGGAAVPPTRDPVRDHYSWVSFSKDGTTWTAPERTLESWHWLWRVTWHKGVAYGVAYNWDPKEPGKSRGILFRSKDGLKYEKVTVLDVGWATEATLAFDGDVMYCLQRCDGKQINHSMLGRSEPPYTAWSWKSLAHLGGPNLLQAPDGAWWAAGRLTGSKSKPQTVLFQLVVKEGKLRPVLTLPSSGDTGYPGMVWHDNELWISYYSSHEGKSSIYLARVKGL